MMESSRNEIRVLVVDDSAFRRDLIGAILESDPEIEVVGYASNGKEAVKKVMELVPDVITMDIQMPVMDGLKATREIMASRPTPIIVVSTMIRDEQQFTFSCLQYGALDFVPVNSDVDTVARELVPKVKMCSRIKVVTHPRSRKCVTARRFFGRGKYRVVGIAVSTGGPAALHDVLVQIPRDFPMPIVVVQHIPEGFTRSLAEWLHGRSSIRVVTARDGSRMEAGTAYLAPAGLHLVVGRDQRFRLIADDFPRCYHKPSADVMLKSIAEVFGPRAIGVIMTGMGRDGAAGIRAINDAGGYTIAQDESTSVIFGMNRVAIEEGSVKEILPLNRIAERLVALTSSRAFKKEEVSCTRKSS